MPLLHVEHLNVGFPLYHGQARSLGRQFGRKLAGLSPAASSLFVQDDRERIMVDVLKDVSFTLRPGERLGLIGGNGAGKTTLLRALAGIYEPVRGRVRVEGSVGTLLDSGLGMNWDLTGRENIRLRGLHARLTPRRIREVEEDVEAFAGLGAYLDMPVKAYSSGMSVRLAFGLATSIVPQILLMDEWFLAGDGAFMQTAQQRLEVLVQKAEILVLSTHQADVMRKWCTRVLWLENGSIRMDATAHEVLDAYLAS